MRIEVDKDIHLELGETYVNIIRYLGPRHMVSERDIHSSLLMHFKETKEPLKKLVSKGYLAVEHQKTVDYYTLTRKKGESLYQAIRALDGLRE